ncbi:MAG: SH3 domain-containing protein [Calditrichaceae bacterium]
MKGALIIFLCLVLSFAVLSSCQKAQEEQSAQQEAAPVVEEVKEIPAVCIWEDASIRADASFKAKWLSKMALGEKVIWLGKEKVDSTDDNRKFYKVRLSDGTEGWVWEHAIATDAKPAIAYKEAPIYRRPDLLTVTDVVLDTMEMVAIVGSDGDWIEVVGHKSEKKGWIQSKLVSIKDIDVAVGLLASKALNEKNKDLKKQKLEAIIDNPAFSASIFIEDIKNKIEDLKPKPEPETEVLQEADSTEITM